MNSFATYLATSVMAFLKMNGDVVGFKLTKNFRSHSQIVKLVSDNFYNGELRPADTSTTDQPTEVTMGMAEALRSGMCGGVFGRVPSNSKIIFADVHSQSIKEERGTSWYYPGGINAIVSTVEGIIATGKVTTKDIGIITMYRSDPDEMAAALAYTGIKATDMLEPETATVDFFQGREKEIIIVHFVAAREATNLFGFARQFQRLNAAQPALLRASKHMLLFGNWHHWQSTRRQWNNNAKHMGRVMDHIARHNTLVVWKDSELRLELAHEGA